MIVDIIHPNAATPKKSEVRDALAKNYKTNADHIIAFGFKTVFGGGKTSGFALIYDSVEAAKYVEPHYRDMVYFFIFLGWLSENFTYYYLYFFLKILHSAEDNLLFSAEKCKIVPPVYVI